MKLLEHEAKKILTNFAIPTPHRLAVISENNRIFESTNTPLVFKSQIPVGGRGKLGGVKVVASNDNTTDIIDQLFLLEIKNFTPHTLLIEEALDIAHEYYLSVAINRSLGVVNLVAHPDGGVDVETQQGFYTQALDGKNFEQVGDSLSELYELEEKSFLLTELIEKLYRCFVQNDATLIEINPLVLTMKGDLIVADCKMVLDDTAAYRHPDWNFEEKAYDTNFVSLNHDGTIATIANGAGLAMATVDTVAQRGLTPANFLDIGGSATVSSIMKSFRRIMEFPNVTHIVINIFGGIVQCDKVAEAIIEAREQLLDLPHLLIRLSGTNAEQARELLAQHDLTLYDSLEEALEEILL